MSDELYFTEDDIPDLPHPFNLPDDDTPGTRYGGGYVSLAEYDAVRRILNAQYTPLKPSQRAKGDDAA